MQCDKRFRVQRLMACSSGVQVWHREDVNRIRDFPATLVNLSLVLFLLLPSRLSPLSDRKLCDGASIFGALEWRRPRLHLPPPQQLLWQVTSCSLTEPPARRGAPNKRLPLQTGLGNWRAWMACGPLSARSSPWEVSASFKHSAVITPSGGRLITLALM